MADPDRSLPQGFEHLEPWVDEWVLPDTQARSEKRLASSMESLQAYYDAVLADAPKILEFLNERQLGAMSAAEERLLKLMLSFAEVIPAVEFYQQPSVIDGFSADAFLVLEELPDLASQQ